MAVSENDLLVGPVIPAVGVATISLDFYFENEDWLEVYKTGSETPLVLDTDYTVAGEGTASGVVTLTTPANGVDAYYVLLMVPAERSSDFALRGDFKSGPVNAELDRVWQRLQRHWTEFNSALRLSPADRTASPIYMDTPEVGRVLVGTAGGVENGPTADEVAAAEGYSVAAATSAAQAALFDGPRFDNITDFGSDTFLTYTAGQDGTVAAGTIIRASGQFVEIASVGASDQHGTTAGGVKWYEAGPNFSTRARMVAAKARMDAAGETVADGVIWTATGFRYRASAGATTISDMAGWLAVAPVYLEHYGVVTSASAAGASTDYSTELQAALDATSGDLHCTGWAYTSSGLSWPDYCGFKIVGDIESGGIVTDSAIGTATNLVDFGTGLGPSIDSLHLWFRQAAGITLRAQLYDHLPLVSFDDASRGNIRHLRISQASKGITAQDGVGGSNPGGWKIQVAEIGAFESPFVTDGGLDFIKIDNVHVWPFGISSDADLMGIWSDGAATGSQIISADGLMIDTFASFQMPLEVGEAASATILPFILGLQLDGDASRLIFKGGRSVISALYSTKTTPSATTIVVEGGTHHLNMPHLIGGEDNMTEVQSGAELNVNGGYLRQHLSANKRGGVVKSGGVLRFKGTHFDFPTGAGTVPFIEQESGGILVVDGCTAPPSNATARSEVVKYNSDVQGNYLDGESLYPHGCTFTANWTTGYYRAGRVVAPLERIATLTPSSTVSTEQTWGSGYSRVRLDLNEVAPATDGAALRFRLRQGGTYNTSGYSWSVFGVSSGAISVSDSTGDVSGLLHPLAITIGNVATNERGVSGWIEIINPGDSGFTNYFGQVRYYDASDAPKSFSISGTLKVAGAVDGAQLFFGVGNIASGEIIIAGYRE